MCIVELNECISGDEDDEQESDPIFFPDENYDKDCNSPIYPREKWPEIISYWENNGKKLKFKTVAFRYKKLKNSSESTLKNWKRRMQQGITFYYNNCTIIFQHLHTHIPNADCSHARVYFAYRFIRRI